MELGSALLQLLWGWGLVIAVPALVALCAFSFRGLELIGGLVSLGARPSAATSWWSMAASKLTGTRLGASMQPYVKLYLESQCATTRQRARQPEQSARVHWRALAESDL